MTELYHDNQSYRPNRYKQFPQAQPGHKYCVACEQEKPHTAFHKMKANHDGYRPTCKVCRKKETAHPVQRPSVITSKICTKCGNERTLEEFDLDKNGKMGRFSQCKVCRGVYNHQFWRDHLDECRKRGKVKGAKPANKIQRMKRHRERMLTDPRYRTLRKEHRQRHYHAHKEQARDFTPRRRARILSATVGTVDYRRILARYGYFCYLCKQPIDPNAKKRSSPSLTFDHVVPLHPRHGEPQGAHAEANLRPAHLACNVRKGNKPLHVLSAYDRRGL